jgi:hypothetical protein
MKFLLAFLFFPFISFAQPGLEELTGLWKGYVSTSEKELPYELLITEKEGRLHGYSHTTFTVAGKEIVSVKKVDIRIQNLSIIVEDEDLLFDNFDAEAPRKIKQTNILFFKEEGKNLVLTGTFENKATRTMRPARGAVLLQKTYTTEDTKLIARLQDLKLEEAIPNTFTAPSDIAIINKTTSPDNTPITPVEKKIIQTDPFITAAPKLSSPDKVVAPTTTVVIPVGEIETELPTLARQAYVRQPYIVARPASRPRSLRAQPHRDEKTIALVRYTVTQALPMPATPATIVVAAPATPAATTGIVKTTPAPQKPVTKPAEPVRTEVAKTTPPTPKPETTQPKPAPVTTPDIAKQATPPAQPTRTNIAVAPALDLANRKIETIDQLLISSDSLVISLYDNGTIDGDSVSIILNGKTIISKQMLSTIAITKTIYLTPDMGDSVQLVMYAENLGTIPPNTGLLVLLFDNQRREIRFSGDLNKNAAITLRRRPK